MHFFESQLQHEIKATSIYFTFECLLLCLSNGLILMANLIFAFAMLNAKIEFLGYKDYELSQSFASKIQYSLFALFCYQSCLFQLFSIETRNFETELLFLLSFCDLKYSLNIFRTIVIRAGTCRKLYPKHKPT